MLWRYEWTRAGGQCLCVSARERCGATAAQGRPKARLSSVPSKMHFRQVAGVFEKMPQLKLEEERPTLSASISSSLCGVRVRYRQGAAGVPLGCPSAPSMVQTSLASVKEAARSTKDLMVIRCAAAVLPARRYRLRSEW